MRNNKGVTLVELLVVIVVMGIIAGFSIPAVGGIIENANKDAVINDAIQVENAARLYCSTTQCEYPMELTWVQLSEYVEGLEGEYSETTGASTTLLAYKVDANGDWGVRLTATNANYSLPAVATTVPGTITVPDTATGITTAEGWYIPSEASRDDLS